MSGSWVDQLLPASWRGVPFAVRRSSIVAGRKTAEHNYPFRDVVWVEDLGLRGRRYAFEGFVVGDDCYDQEASMLAAVETAGPGELVHPSIGSVTVSLVGFTSAQDMDAGRSVSFSFEFVQGAPSPVYPSSGISTQDNVDDAADDADAAAGDDFISDMTNSPLGSVVNDIAGAVSEGADAILAGAAVVTGFAAQALAIISDAGLIANVVTGLVAATGYTYGRYAGGSRSAAQDPSATAASALAALTTATVNANDASAAATWIASAGEVSSEPAAVQTLVMAIAATASSPADQVRLLSGLAAYNPPLTGTSAPIGAAINTAQAASSALCRRASLTAIARACADYQPTSYNEAITLRQNVAALFDAEILIAADADDVGTYQALRALRTAIVLDLNTRAAQLPSLIEVTTPTPTTALSLAWTRYADATRADDVIARAQPIHPAFMPIDMVLLSA